VSEVEVAYNPALHIINAVPVNLSSNHSLLQLRPTGDDFKEAHSRKMYLTLNINAFLKIIHRSIYFFKPAYLVKRNEC
jgi:hypothetical protein